jgi:hypothetical protein
MSKFAAGQVWAYRTRTDVIVHVAVDGVVLGNPVDANRPTQNIGFMPIAEAALDASVTQLVAEDAAFIPSADFEEGYAGWKEAFDAGKAGFWTAPVAKIVQTIDDGMRRT